MPKEGRVLLHHLALHTLIARAPNWVLWILAMGLGLVTFGMLITPDLIPFVDEVIVGWLSVSVLSELRKRGQVKDDVIDALPDPKRLPA